MQELTTIASSAGLGLRIPHLHHILKQQPAIPWFEVHICNFLQSDLNYALLRRVAEIYPLSFHGVSLNLGGTCPLDQGYLASLARAVKELSPVLVSEHACITASEEEFFHDLLPVPYTQAAVDHFVDRIDQVQNILEREILIENLSRYVEYEKSEMRESEFLREVSLRSGCGILCDLNNAYVNQINLGVSVEGFLDDIPLERIGEVHLAGFTQTDEQLVDTHGAPVDDAVWELFEKFLEHAGTRPCLIEWDNQLPGFDRLEHERTKAQKILDRSSPGQSQEPLRERMRQ